jgi:hypothetical protein
MMGNRGGRFHRDDQTLGTRRWASTHWICCELEWKGAHHEPMGRGYTSLFFLDEITALASGHRPCFFCRRAQAKAFLGGRRVAEFDLELHAQRLRPRQTDVADLPDGAMVGHGGQFYAVKGSHLLQWSHSKYVVAIPKKSIITAQQLTPPLVVQILANGFQPRWHPSANTGDWA